MCGRENDVAGAMGRDNRAEASEIAPDLLQGSTRAAAQCNTRLKPIATPEHACIIAEPRSG
jgi:hypothetical protein